MARQPLGLKHLRVGSCFKCGVQGEVLWYCIDTKTGRSRWIPKVKDSYDYTHVFSSKRDFETYNEQLSLRSNLDAISTNLEESLKGSKGISLAT